MKEGKVYQKVKLKLSKYEDNYELKAERIRLKKANKELKKERIESVADNVYLTNEVIQLKQIIMDIKRYVSESPLFEKYSRENKSSLLEKLESGIEKDKIKLKKYEEKLKAFSLLKEFDYLIQCLLNGNICKEDEERINIIKQKLKELKDRKKFHYFTCEEIFKISDIFA